MASAFDYNVSDRTKLTSPAFGRAVMPTSRVGGYINQQLAGLSPTASRPVAPAPVVQRPLQGSAGIYTAADSGRRMAEDIAASNVRMRQSLELAKKKRQQRNAASAPQAGGAAAGGIRVSGVPNTSGVAVNRIQQILKQFPGLRITEIGGNRDYDVAHGVPRVATSYHYDRGNPAIDIAGSTAMLDALYAELTRQGGWRQILWRTAGHYDHLHVA